MEHLSSFFSSHSIFGSCQHPVLVRIGRGHFREIFFPVLSTLLLRIYKHGEYKCEGVWVGAGAGVTGGENGFLQVVTVQSSTDTDFQSESGDRSIFNGQYSYIVPMNVLCFTQSIQQRLLYKWRYLQDIYRDSFNRRNVYPGYILSLWQKPLYEWRCLQEIYGITFKRSGVYSGIR